MKIGLNETGEKLTLELGTLEANCLYNLLQVITGKSNLTMEDISFASKTRKELNYFVGE